MTYCTGCSFYYHAQGVCNLLQLYCNLGLKNESGECPCTKCIVKIMCAEPCEVFDTFYWNNRNNLNLFDHR